MLYNFDGLSFNVLTVARFRHRAGFFDVRKRPFGALSYKIDGTGEFVINGKPISVKPKSILYIPADADYQVKYSVNDSIVIHITDCNYFEPECITLENHVMIEQLFLKLVSAWEQNRSVNQIKSGLYDILFRISQQKSEAHNSTVNLCMEYIQQHFAKADLSVSEVCRSAFVSVSTIQRAFLEQLGITPKQYIIKLRLEKAFELLMEGKLTVKDVALCCGFSDEKFFSRSFKEKYGYPPSQLHKNIVV